MAAVSSARAPRRGVYLLPALFTLGNLLCGFFCIIQSSRGKFAEAALLIVYAGILDALDGRVARLTGTASEFGVQLDSMADIVSFGLAPSLLAYYWALTPFRRVGWLIAFLFVVCAATRLARFNIQTATADKRWFAGLPSPAAAGLVATLVYAVVEPPQERWAIGLVAAVVVAAAALMVSRFRYRSFKDVGQRRRLPSLAVLMIAVMLVIFLSEPRYTLVAAAATYALSAPVAYLFGLAARGRTRGKEAADGPAAG